jgi:hypothetical protein
LTNWTTHVTHVRTEERRRLGLVRFSLAMEDMSRLVSAAGFGNHDDDDEEDEVTL